MRKNEMNKKSHRGLYIGGAIVAFAIIAVCGIFVWKNIKSKQYTTYMENAQKYVETGDYTNAIVSYESAIKVNEKQIRPYEGLGEVYTVLKQYSSARVIYQKGYAVTGSERLNYMYMKLDGLVDGQDMSNVTVTMEGNGSNGEWNDGLISQLGTFNFTNYKEKYGSGQIATSGSSCKIVYQELSATVVYENKEGKNVFDSSSGTPYEGAVPSYLVFNDLTTIFYGCENGMTLDAIQAISGVTPVVLEENNGYIVSFTYLSCDFSIECDAAGTIANQYASNKVVPLAKSATKTLGTAAGNVVDATTGYALEKVSVQLKKISNGEIVATAVTNASGDFSIQAEGGDYTLCFVMDGYVEEEISVSISNNLTEQVGVKAMSPELANGEWRIVLEWNGEPKDLDAHLITSSYHVFFGNPNGQNGDESVNLDVDDTDGYGPETITISSMNKDTTYRFYVHDFSNAATGDSSELEKSDAVVKLYMPNGDVYQYDVPAGKGVLWNVFEISNGKVKEIGDMKTSSDDVR